MNHKTMARNLVGMLLMLAGLAFGVWAGLWWAFIGGIVQFVEALKADPVNTLDVALGIARVACAGFIGGLTAIVAVFPGFAMLKV